MDYSVLSGSLTGDNKTNVYVVYRPVSKTKLIGKKTFTTLLRIEKADINEVKVVGNIQNVEEKVI